jgi:hypothetical protein
MSWSEQTSIAPPEAAKVGGLFHLMASMAASARGRELSRARLIVIIFRRWAGSALARIAAKELVECKD